MTQPDNIRPDNIDAALIDDELKKSEARFLRKGVLFSAIQSIFVVISFQFGTIPPEFITATTLLMLFTAIALFVTFWWLGRAQDSYRYVYLIRFLLLCLIQICTLYMAYLATTPYSLTTVLIFNVASGSIIGASGRLLGVYFAGITLAWVFVLWQKIVPSNPEFRYALFLFGISVGLATVLHIVRRNTLLELVHLRLTERNRNQELEEAKSALELQKQQLTDTVQELEQAKILAESASHAKSDFLAIISHEIRTPMNGVMGMASLLESSKLSVEQQEYVETIRTSGEALLNIINDILDFSKVEAGSLRLDSLPFQLSQLVEDVVNLFLPLAAEKQVQLSYTIASNLPAWIVGDANRLKQILMNLVNNAIKFTDLGSIVFSVDCETDADPSLLETPSYAIHFAVKDTGIGISSEKIDHLFQPFSQLDQSTTRKYGGTGLGLAISKRLCELMGGRMWVESTLGAGSTFHFVVRLQAYQDESHAAQSLVAGQAEERQSLPRAIGDPEFARQYPLRILVAEDNLVNQKVARLLLGKLGYQVDIVANGREVVAATEKTQYDLILMDVQMPEMDGLQATRLIRSRSRSSAQPRIVAMTAGVMPEEVRDFLAAGMDACVSKPIRIDQLTSQLKLCSAMTQQQSGGEEESIQSVLDASSEAERGVRSNQ